MPEKELERILVELAGAGQVITPEQLQSMIDSVGNGINYVTKQVVTENGNVATIYQLVNPATLATSSLALLTMEVPTAMAFIGPALGIAVGAGILSQTEPFQNVGNLIGEKIYAFLNSDGQILFPEETIQAFAEKFNEEGAFDGGYIYDEDLYELLSNNNPDFPNFAEERQPLPIKSIRFKTYAAGATRYYELEGEGGNNCFLMMHIFAQGGGGKIYVPGPILLSMNNFRVIQRTYDSTYSTLISEHYVTTSTNTITVSGEQYQYYYYQPVVFSDAEVFTEATLLRYDYEHESSPLFRQLSVYLAHGGRIVNPYLQPSAVIPSPIPLSIPTTYPSWTPSTAPGVVPAPNIYPIEIPAAQPVPEVEPTPQPQIQSPAPITNPETDPRSAPTTEIITQTQPQVYPNPVPQPSPDPDPAPSVDPDPSLDPSQPVEPNPPSANTDPDPTTPTIIDPSLVSGSAGKLFTVYNPSSTGLNDLGAYLWSTNIIDIVKSIWQNPMDGIISYFVLYATPEANRTSTIYLGALDSGVSSPVVTNQFIDIDCGEVQIKEKWNNIGDYPPYTSIKLFLPFVGFVDINPDDVMGRDDGGGYIKVTYRVDVYTGTCLAQVWVRRAADMANYQILYTYNGNCAQQIPLTGATYQGLMQTLVGASVGFASAGLTGALASAATQFAGHQQVQMQRSGNMSANAGVLGQRKPYLIISRNNVYYATNFAEYYGYPAHATVVLGNMSGYVRVRDIHLEVPATSEELDEIEALLKEGVWF